MNDLTSVDGYGQLIEPATLKIQRMLPGPAERIWSYLTDSDLRSKWLASGVMEPRAGADFTLTWRNDNLTNPPGQRPEGFSEEHSMASHIVEFDPPRKLVFTWDESGDVSIELEPKGKNVLLTLIHRRLPRRSMLLGVSAGWHLHLDLLAARAAERDTPVFWEEWARLRAAYENRIPE